MEWITLQVLRKKPIISHFLNLSKKDNPQVWMELTTVFFVNFLRNLLSHSAHFLINLLRQVSFHNVGKQLTYVRFLRTEIVLFKLPPVSLLCTPAKVMESAVFKHFYNHFNAYNIIKPLQSGLTSGDSTTNQLTFLYDTFCQALDTGKEVQVVYCDISKAFDRACLLHKLQAAIVLDNLLRWFDSYLTNQK